MYVQYTITCLAVSLILPWGKDGKQQQQKEINVFYMIQWLSGFVNIFLFLDIQWLYNTLYRCIKIGNTRIYFPSWYNMNDFHFFSTYNNLFFLVSFPSWCRKCWFGGGQSFITRLQNFGSRSRVSNIHNICIHKYI